LADLKVANLILVKPGERIAVDGIVTEGESFVDESAINGESVASEKRAGDKVVSGSINMSGSIIFMAEKVGKDTVLSQIIKVVRESQASKAPVQRIVDKVASVFVPVVVAASLLTFVLWIIIGGSELFPMALVSAISVLVIACPCAMGLATPTALMVGIGKAAQNHILIKDATAIEQMRRVDTVVLDKTGTITTGKPAVTDWIWMESDQSGYIEGCTRDEFRSAIASMEIRSEHPLAYAVVNFLETEGVLPAENLESFETTAGHGVSASFKGKHLWAGNHRLALERCGEDYMSKKESFKREGKSILFMGIESRCVAVVAIADKVKESSTEAVRELKKLGIDVHMLTGDNESVAENVAKITGVSHYLSGVLPTEKQEYVTKQQRQGRVVAMVGDGINDSQALSVADVSIAMGKGTDVAMDVAMMTLITSDLRLLPAAFAISGRTVRLIHQNLFWAFFYNVIGIPIAAGLLYPFTGIMLNPMIAAAAMAFSSVSVVLNSLRLGRFNYHPKG
jgi:copper-(or silver)-translocating P-type ATPase